MGWGRQDWLDKGPCISTMRDVGGTHLLLCTCTEPLWQSANFICFWLVERDDYEVDVQIPYSPPQTNYLSKFLALHCVQGKLFPPPVVFSCSTDSARQCFCRGLAVQGRAAQPAAGIATCSPREMLFFWCRHSLQLLIQGLGSLSTDYDSLQVRLLHFAAFSVSFVRTLQPDFHSFLPELGLECVQGFPFCFTWAGEAFLLLVLCSRVEASLLMRALL